MIRLPTIALALCLLAGCASYRNACLIDAQCQVARLREHGIPARVAIIQTPTPARHAFAVWSESGRVFWWDARGGTRISRAVSLDDRDGLERSFRILAHPQARFIGWADEAESDELCMAGVLADLLAEQEADNAR